MWEEGGGQLDSVRRDGIDDGIGSASVLEHLRNMPMYSPQSSPTGWCTDQVLCPSLDYIAVGLTRPKQVLEQIFFVAVLSKVWIRSIGKVTIADPDSSPGFVTKRKYWRAARRIRIIQYFTEKESNAQVRLLQQRNDGVVVRDEQNVTAIPVNEVDSSEQQIFGAEFIGHKVAREKKCCKKKNTTETPKRKNRTKHFNITLEDIRQHFGRKRAEAAKALGVSVPTLKRYCRKYGIERWNGDGCPRVKPELLDNSVHQISPGSIPPEIQGEKETSALLGAKQDAVTIKAKFGERIFKFPLSSESGLAELKQAVAKRVLLEVGSFDFEYQDKDKDWISIVVDEDFQYYVNESKLSSNQVIKLRVKSCSG